MIAWRWVDVDSADPAGLAAFWGQVFGVPPSDEGGSCEDDGPMWSVAPADCSVKLLFVPVPEGKSVKNRLHLDLYADDRDAEVARVVALGATPTDVGQRPEQRFRVLADPEGNEFCIIPATRVS